MDTSQILVAGRVACRLCIGLDNGNHDILPEKRHTLSEVLAAATRHDHANHTFDIDWVNRVTGQ